MEGKGGGGGLRGRRKAGHVRETTPNAFSSALLRPEFVARVTIVLSFPPFVSIPLSLSLSPSLFVSLSFLRVRGKAEFTSVSLNPLAV